MASSPLHLMLHPCSEVTNRINRTTHFAAIAAGRHMHSTSSLCAACSASDRMSVTAWAMRVAVSACCVCCACCSPHLAWMSGATLAGPSTSSASRKPVWSRSRLRSTTPPLHVGGAGSAVHAVVRWDICYDTMPQVTSLNSSSVWHPLVLLLSSSPQHPEGGHVGALVDGSLPQLALPLNQQPLVKGDALAAQEGVARTDSMCPVYSHKLPGTVDSRHSLRSSFRPAFTACCGQHACQHTAGTAGTAGSNTTAASPHAVVDASPQHNAVAITSCRL